MTFPEAPAVRVESLSKTYAGGVEAVRDLNLEIPQGRFFGLLGPNGAGKSTLIRILCGLVRPTSGSAAIFGHDCHGDAVDAHRMTGLAPQEPTLDRFLTVRETLVYHGGYFGMSRTARREKADELIDTFDLGAKTNVRTNRLSGGMKRRLLLARAFMHDPPLLILDEPTAGVDIELRHDLWHYIRRLHASGRTVLLTTHYLEEAEQLCDDVALIRDGQIAARGTPDELKQQFAADSIEDVYLRVMQ